MMSIHLRGPISHIADLKGLMRKEEGRIFTKDVRDDITIKLILTPSTIPTPCGGHLDTYSVLDS